MKVYNLSGGATKIGGLFAKSERIIKEFGYKPDIITGVSSGALLALPIALGKWDEMKTLINNITLDLIFDKKPVNEKGKFTLKGILRILVGKPSLGTENNLRKVLSKIITEKDYDKFLNGRYPEIYVGATNFNTGQFEVVNLKNISYGTYLDYVIASTSIPLAVEGVDIKGNIFFDGGVLHHTCTKFILEKYKNKISHCITVFSRPKYPDTSYTQFNQIDVSQVFNVMVDLQTTYVSIKDQDFEKLLCDEYKIKNIQVFCPKILTSMYDVDPVRLKELYDRSYANEQKKYYTDFLNNK